jgi:hypothetical protein
VKDATAVTGSCAINFQFMNISFYLSDNVVHTEVHSSDDLIQALQLSTYSIGH